MKEGTEFQKGLASAISQAKATLSKTLPITSSCTPQMETGLEEEEEEKRMRNQKRKNQKEEEEDMEAQPHFSAPYLPQVDKADYDPEEEQPQRIEVEDTLRQPLYVHRHQVDHIPCCAGLPGTTGQHQDLGRYGEEGMRREGREWALSAGPASVYHLCSEPVNSKPTSRGGHEDLGWRSTLLKIKKLDRWWSWLFRLMLEMPVPILRAVSFPQMPGPEPGCIALISLSQTLESLW